MIPAYRTDRTPTWNRKAATMADPMMFAKVYLSHHLRSDETGGEMTFSSVHYAWCNSAKKWMLPIGEPMANREAHVGPRSMGKSTWWFLILPMWAAAFGHVKFAAAFADSASQAETHLQTFKHELDTNAKLRLDFPELCAPARRPRGTQVADNRAMLFAASGFVFAARGIDSSNLGMKVGERRPDLLIFDDVEPDESSYSADLAKKRLGTLVDAILPLNVNARVVIAGTVTMPGSIVHQLVRSVRETGAPEKWITDEKIKCHYYAPIVSDKSGAEVSVWPGRWSMEFLQSIRHTNSFAKNYANDPRGIDGAYWSQQDYVYGDDAGHAHRWLISVDPAVTTKKTSDFTGISVVSARRDGSKKAVVHYATEVKLKGDELRDFLIELCDTFPEIGLILVEVNQGGDTWRDVILHDMPVKVVTKWQGIKKEIRAARAHAHYQRGRVLHARRLDRLEEQQIAFPRAPHDDMVDATGTALIYFLGPFPATQKSGASKSSYT